MLFALLGLIVPAYVIYSVIMVCTVFYRATACNAMHGTALAILSVRLSVVCPSVRRVYCDKTK